MLAGLQGSGKTTASAKLARLLEATGSRVAARRRRPPAPGRGRAAPRASASASASRSSPTAHRSGRGGARRGRGGGAARPQRGDRRHRGPAPDRRRTLMDELRQVRDAVKPDDSLLVVDAMTGQEAVNVADGVRRGRRPHRRRPHQDRRRRPGWCGAVGQGGRRHADPLRRYRREARRLRGVPPRPHGEPHPRHGRRAHAHREGRSRPSTRRRPRRRARSCARASSPSTTSSTRCARSARWARSRTSSRMLPGVPKELKNAEIDESELARVEAIICSMTLEERTTHRSSTGRAGCGSPGGAARPPRTSTRC